MSYSDKSPPHMGIGLLKNISKAFNRSSNIHSGSFFIREISSTTSFVKPLSVLKTETSRSWKPYLYSPISGAFLAILYNLLSFIYPHFFQRLSMRELHNRFSQGIVTPLEGRRYPLIHLYSHLLLTSFEKMFLTSLILHPLFHL